MSNVGTSVVASYCFCFCRDLRGITRPWVYYCPCLWWFCLHSHDGSRAEYTAAEIILYRFSTFLSYYFSSYRCFSQSTNSCRFILFFICGNERKFCKNSLDISYPRRMISKIDCAIFDFFLSLPAVRIKRIIVSCDRAFLCHIMIKENSKNTWLYETMIYSILTAGNDSREKSEIAQSTLLATRRSYAMPKPLLKIFRAFRTWNVI